MKYGILTKHTARPGKRDEFVAHLLRYGAQLESNPDCSHWIIHTTDDPNTIWAYVVWSSKEAHDAALAPDAVKAQIAESRQFMSEDVMPEQVFVTPVGGKGL